MNFVIAVVTVVIVVVFFWLLASIRGLLAMILEEFQKAAHPKMIFEAPPQHVNCRTIHGLNETEFTPEMADKLKQSNITEHSQMGSSQPKILRKTWICSI